MATIYCSALFIESAGAIWVKLIHIFPVAPLVVKRNVQGMDVSSRGGEVFVEDSRKGQLKLSGRSVFDQSTPIVPPT